jgi:hypothetical protein
MSELCCYTLEIYQLLDNVCDPCDGESGEDKGANGLLSEPKFGVAVQTRHDSHNLHFV